MSRVAQSLLVLVLVLAMVEVSLQGFYFLTTGGFLPRRVALPMFAPDPDASFWLKPDNSFTHKTQEFQASVHVNGQGFRVADPSHLHPLAKPPATFRIMLLGASYPFGWGVDFEHSFAARLVRLLEGGGYADGLPIELINACVPGLIPGSNLAWYENQGSAFRPDLVIQVVTGTMAITEERNTSTVDEDGYIVPAGMTARGWAEYYLKKLGIVFYPWLVVTRLEDQLRASGEDAAPVEEVSSFEGFDPAAPELEPSFRFYRRLERSVAASGARLLVLFTPVSHRIHPEDVARWRLKGQPPVGERIEFNRDFCRHLSATGIDCVDVTPALLAAARASDERLYYWLDSHWTIQGNRVVADSVATHMLPGSGPAPADGSVASEATLR